MIKPVEQHEAVSIHASSREDATSSVVPVPAILSGFNPRVLAGGRDKLGFALAMVTRVSIHASSREDATSLLPPMTGSNSFNPRVLAGGRDLTTTES